MIGSLVRQLGFRACGVCKALLDHVMREVRSLGAPIAEGASACRAPLHRGPCGATSWRKPYWNAERRTRQLAPGRALSGFPQRTMLRSGTRCAFAAFMRSARTVQTAPSKSISSQRPAERLARPRRRQYRELKGPRAYRLPLAQLRDKARHLAPGHCGMVAAR